jgi:hypothetical protein
VGLRAGNVRVRLRAGRVRVCLLAGVCMYVRGRPHARVCVQRDDRTQSAGEAILPQYSRVPASTRVGRCYTEGRTSRVVCVIVTDTSRADSARWFP